jgi:hypothetical protein
MKLNKDCPLYRYEIADVFNISAKKLYRMLKKGKVDIPLGIVMPNDLEKIEQVVLGKNDLKEASNTVISNQNIPQNS